MNMCQELCEQIKKALDAQDQELVIDNLRLLHAYVQGRFLTKLPLNCGDFDDFIEDVKEAAESLDYEDVKSLIDGREW